MNRIKSILFNTDMVQATLDERKMVTRRICKDTGERCVPDMSFYNADKRTFAVHNYADIFHTDQISLAERACPICPGDILYIRETWCVNPNYKEFYYRADRRIGTPAPYGLKWKPSIHMPKKAARIWLKVTDVRVERLQNMTLDDFLKEGITVRPEAFNDPETAYMQARRMFKQLWDSTIRKNQIDVYGWDANPWVWVVEFERCEKPESER